MGCRISSDDEFMVTSSVDGVFQWRVVDAEEEEEDVERIHNAAAARLKAINDQWGDEEEREENSEEEGEEQREEEEEESEESPGSSPPGSAGPPQTAADLGIDKRLLSGEVADPSRPPGAVFAETSSAGMGLAAGAGMGMVVSCSCTPLPFSTPTHPQTCCARGCNLTAVLLCALCRRTVRLRRTPAAIARRARTSTTLR